MSLVRHEPLAINESYQLSHNQLCISWLMIFYIFAHSLISQEIPGQGIYEIRMIPYHDAQFTSPYEGEVEIQVNQQMYVAVEVEGVDVNQIATVLDNCWATPVNDIDHDIRWSLIIRE